MGVIYKYYQHVACGGCGKQVVLQHWDRLYADRHWVCPECGRGREIEDRNSYYVPRGTNYRIPLWSKRALLLVKAPTFILAFLGIGTFLVFFLKLVFSGLLPAQQFIVHMLQRSSGGFFETVILFAMVYYLFRAIEILVFARSRARSGARGTEADRETGTG